MTKIIPASLIALALALGASCAGGGPETGCAGGRPDWIEQTLVTADVTGTWRTVEGVALRLVLEQRGTKVTGRMFMQPSVHSAGAEIEGSVSGDVFRFNQSSGSTFRGEMKVSGDDMNGCVRSVAPSRGDVRLQRLSSP